MTDSINDGGAAHDCVKRINEQLAQANTKIATALLLGDSPTEALIVMTTKVDIAKRGKPTSLLASYCPFCGISLHALSASKGDANG